MRFAVTGLLLLSFAAPLLLDAQEKPAAQGITVTKRDSAGAAIFESSVAATLPAAPFSVDTTPVLRIGVFTPGGDTMSVIRRLSDARILRSGTIVVGDDYDGRLRFYSRYGTFIKSAGSQDTGQAHLSAIRALAVRGDTLVVGTPSGVSLFSAAGNFLSATPPFRGDLLAVTPSGRYLVRRTTSETGAFQGQKGVVKSLLTDTLFFVSHAGVFSGRVAALPARIHVSVFNPDPNPLGLTITYLESPFEPESYYVAAPTGFYYTDGRRVEARLYNTMGRLTRIVRLQVPAPAVTPAMTDAYKQAILRKYTVEDTRRYIEWVLGQYTAPERVPQVRAMKVASDGRIWLRQHVFPASDLAQWHVFSPAGEYEGVVSLPSRWKVHQIDNEAMLISQPAAAGNLLVSVHSITHTAPRP